MIYMESITKDIVSPESYLASTIAAILNRDPTVKSILMNCASPDFDFDVTNALFASVIISVIKTSPVLREAVVLWAKEIEQEGITNIE